MQIFQNQFSCVSCLANLPSGGWRSLKVAFHLQVVLLAHNLHHQSSSLSRLCTVEGLKGLKGSQRVLPRDTMGSPGVFEGWKKMGI